MKVGIFDPEDRLDRDFDFSQSEPIELLRIESVAEGTEIESGLSSVAPVGESALLDLFRADIEAPIIPVAVDAGVMSVPKSEFQAAIDSLAEGNLDLVDVPTIEVQLGNRTFRALMDVMAVTAEPARISEYRTTKGKDGTVIDRVRADGVVVSGPAGTPGYGTAVEGPVLDPGVRGLAVVPVAPFRTQHPRWVLAPPIEIEVVREEVPVSLVLDDREVETVPANESLRLEWGKPLEVAVLDQSVSPLDVTKSVE